MNRFAAASTTIPTRPVLSTSSGGSGSYLAWLNWKMAAVIIVAILLITMAYYTYVQYVNSKTSFYANREHMPEGQGGTADKNATVMLFYVDWCPHCKTAKPEWDNLKSQYEGKSINGYNIAFVEYNCTTETAEISELMTKYNIDGYPTIKLLKDNQIVEYDAKPTKATLEQFLNTVL